MPDFDAALSARPHIMSRVLVHTVRTHEAAESQAFGVALGERIRGGACVCLSGPLGAGQPVFVRSQVEAAAAELESFYLLRGYYRVVVRVDRVAWSGDRSEADVTIAVDEGIRYEVTRIEFEGIEPLDLGLVGHPYQARLPVQAAAGLRRKLLEEGYQRCRIDTLYRFIEDNRMITCETMPPLPEPSAIPSCDEIYDRCPAARALRVL